MVGSVVKLNAILTWGQYFLQNALKSSYQGPPENLYKVEPTFNEKISHWQGDITSLEVDAIVNAANKQLIAGGGVDGAIHKRAGEELQPFLDRFNGCRVGEAVTSPGFDLPAKYIIHTVGPQEQDAQKLAQCYQSTFKRMLEQGIRTIAFPCISTGIYGYPNEDAAHVAIKQSRDFVRRNSDKVDRIIFCTFLEKDKVIYDELLQRYYPVEEKADNLQTLEQFHAAIGKLPSEEMAEMEKSMKPNNECEWKSKV